MKGRSLVGKVAVDIGAFFRRQLDSAGEDGRDRVRL